MLQALPPPVLAFALLVVAAALIAAATRWHRPHTTGKLQLTAGHPAAIQAVAHAATGAWILGNAVLTAGAVTALGMALGVAMGDGPPAAPWDVLLSGEVLALAGVALLIWFAEAETSRGLLLLGAGAAAGLTAASSPLVASFGVPLQPGTAGAALAAAVLAPLLLSAGSRAMLITRVRKAAMNAAGDHIMVIDSTGGLMHATEETRKTLGLGGRTGAGGTLPNALLQLVRDEQARRARLRTKSGRMLEAWATRSLARGPLKRARGMLIRDITGRYRDERRLVKLAHYDSLTGLANRRLFLETLTKELDSANRTGSRTALFYIDLDDFKNINDSLGHGAGDMLLEALAERFQTYLRPDEVAQFGIGADAPLMVARLSGDEFAVIAPRLSDGQTAYDLARWILELVSRPVELSDRTLIASASIGIAMCPEDGNDLDTLIRHADTALYAAKSKGRRRFARYEASFDEKADRARSLEEGLRHAIERDELRLFYQPKVDTRTGAVVGFEALLRWKNADLGDVGPAEFIPVAEERGLITELGGWCLHKACGQMREWMDAGFEVVPVAVNVSSHQFTETDLQSVVSDALNQNKIDPRYLELELTESLLLNEGDNVELVLRDLRAIGVHIALDDFGTGYSALTYLNRFNLDVLKMDRGLLRDIDTNPSALGIASAVVAMAHSLGLSVVAEGVDVEEQVEILRNMRCDMIQGFLYSPAVPPEDVGRFLSPAGQPPPICSPRGTSPGDRPKTDGGVVEHDDAPVLRGVAAAEFEQTLGGEGLHDRGRVLLIDDGDETLGLAALRLGRLGIDIHYAAAIDEAHLFVAQEGKGIRVIAAPPTIDFEGLKGVVEHLTELCGERRRVVVIGERAEEDVRTTIREAGVDWVLWAPFNDVELRCLMKSAMALSGEIADRREPRVPVELIANISSGTRRETAVVSSLSPRGAFIEISDPLPVGTSLRIEMAMPQDRFRGFARVVHVQHEDATRPYEPSGMGVSFFGSDRDTERILRKAVKELEGRYLP
jgi:diguanylate cyclase (GGDEF)-like protein